MKLCGGWHSDIGKREVNQDGGIYREQIKDGEVFAIAAVCDGIGGLSHGELASSYLTEQIGLWFDAVSEWLDIGRVNPGLLFSHLKDAVENWNEGVRRLCQEQQLRTGSTMSVLMLVRDFYYIVHVGDSRIYRFDENSGLERLTRDDSVARVKNGRVKNYLSNFMGKEDALIFQEAEGRIRGNEIFFVCSDGFYHNLTEDDVIALHAECREAEAVEKACERVVKKMLARGERDNITISAVLAKRTGEEETG